MANCYGPTYFAKVYTGAATDAIGAAIATQRYVIDHIHIHANTMTEAVILIGGGAAADDSTVYKMTSAGNADFAAIPENGIRLAVNKGLTCKVTGTAVDATVIIGYHLEP